MEQQVRTFLHSKGIEVNNKSNEAHHQLPRRNNTGNPARVVRFANRKHKIMIKGSDVFVNEHLKGKNADMARKARLPRKQGKIQNMWKQDRKTFIDLKGSPEEPDGLRYL